MFRKRSLGGPSAKYRELSHVTVMVLVYFFQAAPAQAPSTPLSPTARRLRAASEQFADGRISAEEKAAIKDSIIRTSGGKASARPARHVPENGRWGPLRSTGN